jgi:DNA repair protein RadA/Sms
MPKSKSIYRCTECGHEHPKWVGRCEACAAWNSVAEEPAVVRSGNAGRSGRGRLGSSSSTLSPSSAPVRLREVTAESLERWRTGIPEFDFVLGGGIVPGSMTLIGGEPGIGKSTLLLQAAARLENAGHRVLYTSGEESPDQIRLRADRLINEDAGPVHVLGETRLESIIQAVGTVGADVVVIDSIQTVYTDQLESAPGNVGQVRECSGQLMRFAKESGTSVIVVGHVTKGGGIAGPKTLEHIVDTVLYFEGEATLDYRLLRTTKNRFGSVDELGVFSMTETGLVAVPNPSAVFLAARAGGTSGSAVTALMEGTRPVLVEVQALAAKSGYGTPQRVATGLDPRRLAVLLAVLERRAATSFANLDVFVQVTAGVRLNEPGADLAVAAALLSSLYNRPAPADVVFLGEIGLGGEIRPSGAVERRIAEAVRLGFPRVFGSSRSTVQVPGASLVGLDHVDQLVQALAA